MSSEAEGEKISLAVGGRDTGKTTYVRGNKELNVEGFFEMYLNAGIKILIIDTIDHPKYQDIPIMPIDMLHRFQSGIYRIIIPDEEDFPLLYEMLIHCRNLDYMFLVFEDASKYCYEKLHRRLKRFLLDAKNRHIGVLFMYHAWEWIPNGLCKLINLLQVFKTADSPELKKRQMPGYFEMAMIIYERVKSHPLAWYSEMLITGI